MPVLDCCIHSSEEAHQAARVRESIQNTPFYPIINTAPVQPSTRSDSDPIDDAKARKALAERLSEMSGPSQLKQLLDLDAAAQRKVEEKEKQNKFNQLTSGMGAIYEIKRHDGSSTHVGWIADSGDPVDLAGNPLAFDLNVTYQTMVATGPASQGSMPAVIVPGINRPVNARSGWAPSGRTPVIVKTGSTAPSITTTNTTTLPPGIQGWNAIKYTSTAVGASSAQFQAVNTYPTGDSENSNPEFDPVWYRTVWSGRDDISIDPDEYPDEVAHFWFDVICRPKKDFDEERNVTEWPAVTYSFHSNMSYKAATMVLFALQLTSQSVTRLIEVWDFENERSEWVVV
jgi:hypothetical protein